MDLKKKVALVTGGGYGVGRGIALRLAAAGASVVVDDVDEARGRETVAKIEAARGRAAFVRADVTIDDDVRRMIAFACETLGGLDVLVNNAGFSGDPPHFPEAEPACWQRVLDVYLRAVMVGVQEGVRAMRERGGVIVNMSSGAGVGFGPHDWPEYAAVKAAVWRLTAALGDLPERANVRVNCICPGWVATENVRERVSRMSVRERKAQRVPDRMLLPADVGDAVVELARDESMSGRVLLYETPDDRRLAPIDSMP